MKYDAPVTLSEHTKAKLNQAYPDDNARDRVLKAVNTIALELRSEERLEESEAIQILLEFLVNADFEDFGYDEDLDYELMEDEIL